MTLAARVHVWDGDPAVERIVLPDRGRGETLVAVAAASVAHIDLTVASGTFAFRPRLPWTPGTEGAGHVLESDALERGTPVRVRGGGVGLDRDGLWAHAAIVPDAAVVPSPPDVDPKLAAAFFSPALTAHAAVHELAQVRPGERVAVMGAAGAVGSLVVQLALEAGAAVVGVDAAAKLPSIAGGALAVPALDGQDRFDVLIDMVGGEDLPARVTGAIVPGGRAVIVGYAAGASATFDLPLLLAADVRLIPMNLIRWGPRLAGEADSLLARLARGELDLPLTVLRLSDIGEAVRHVRDGTATGRVVVTMNRED